MGHRSSLLALVMVLAWLLHFACGRSTAAAQDFDVLVIRAPNSDDKFSRLVGSVIELNSEQATFVAKGASREQKIAISRVADFEPSRSANSQLARLHLAAGEFEAALSTLEKALTEEKITWKKQELEALKAQCEFGLGDIDAAGKRLAPLVKADPDSRLLGYLPVAWVDGFKKPSEVNLAAWAGDPSPALKLMAASWMLTGEKRKQAAEQLEKLAQGASKRIGAMAEAQLWRVKMPTATAIDVQRWFDRAAGFPEDLRAGPYFVIGQAAARVNQPQRAAEAWMQVSLLHPLHSTLAFESQFLAARQLEQAGSKSDAISLYERIAALPENAPHRDEAIQALAQLRGAAK